MHCGKVDGWRPMSQMARTRLSTLDASLLSHGRAPPKATTRSRCSWSLRGVGARRVTYVWLDSFSCWSCRSLPFRSLGRGQVPTRPTALRHYGTTALRHYGTTTPSPPLHLDNFPSSSQLRALLPLPPCFPRTTPPSLPPSPHSLHPLLVGSCLQRPSPGKLRSLIRSRLPLLPPATDPGLSV